MPGIRYYFGHMFIWPIGKGKMMNKESHSEHEHHGCCSHGTGEHQHGKGGCCSQEEKQETGGCCGGKGLHQNGHGGCCGRK